MWFPALGSVGAMFLCFLWKSRFDVLPYSSGQVSSHNFCLFPCVTHREVGYNLWITSKAPFGVKLERLSIASFCYITPMCFSGYWEIPLDFFPTNQPPWCFSVHTCLLLQSSSKCCSLNPPHAWHPFCWLLQLARLQWVMLRKHN